MKSDYEVRKTLGRYVVYRVEDGVFLRQGSFASEKEAYVQINKSIKHLRI